MNHDAFDRLRAADPAHQVPEPAAGVLRAKVDALIGAEAPAAGTPDDGTPAGGPGADELARRRSRRRQPWLLAAAVAGIVAVGGGGYAAGSNGLLSAASDASDGSGAATMSEAAPPITLDRADAPEGAQAPAMGAESESLQEVAPDAQDEVGREPMVGTYLYPGPSRTVFHPGASLSDDGGELAAYALDAQSSYTKETAEAAARALGVRADARQEGGAWVVGANDGTGASVRLAADGRTSLWYTDAQPDTWRCTDIEPALPQDGADDGLEGQSSAGTAPDAKEGGAPPCLGTDTGSVPATEAIAELRRLMEALDVDVQAFDFEASPSGMGTTVAAYHRIDGRRTGLSWSATLSGTGTKTRFVSLNGFLAPVEELGTYPVVSEREAVERLGDLRFSASLGNIRPLAAASGDAGTSTTDAPAPEGPPATLEPGAPLSWPVRDVTITDARLGVAQHVLDDGAVALIPAYELTGDGGAWSVVAVADDFLDFAGR
ncbi:hypothetical protein [Myceligenerans indicum]|uniref:Uncharacterized protein n=1 Tax=Myceligenerans indicum TaxID=2593663 RepID=A0ABS1LPD9_9MICO|nr:hypothetical protein [Myceligenerans indicum]MBL0888121.1 hypothetical protein [Myceligenerans indicum]